jgi:DNA polymerase-3 subunit gamma/tau
MSFYLKYRPKTFAEVKGNETIITSLEGLLSNIDECPHVFLFHGNTGCGKTTLSRILAERLGCVGSDLKEVDSADFRGIDTIREIGKNCQYKSLEGRCRVWIIDECHKLTGDAQNAFLKRLEDTPKHVYFILCTTESEKLIAAIKGRCQQFQVQPLSDSQMLGLLRGIVRKEGQTLEKEVYEQIIQDSLGHSRNAIQILEQVLTLPSEKRVEAVKRIAEEQSQVIELCRALLKNAGWKEVSAILTGLKGQDAETIRRTVLGYCQAVLLKGDNKQAALIIQNFWEPTYNIGFPGITFMCYSIIRG